MDARSLQAAIGDALAQATAPSSSTSDRSTTPSQALLLPLRRAAGTPLAAVTALSLLADPARLDKLLERLGVDAVFSTARTLEALAGIGSGPSEVLGRR